VGLDAAELGLGRIKHDGVDPEFGEEFDEVSAGVGDKFVGEEVAVADDNTEGGARSGQGKRKDCQERRRDQEKLIAGGDDSSMRRGMLPPNEAFVMG
jgi:hypothetical protein